jgi:hypothetical protein
MPRSYQPRRRNIRHKRAAVRWLAANYSDHTLKECAVVLGLTVGKVKYLCRTHKISKRAPNGTRWCSKKPRLAP